MRPPGSGSHNPSVSRLLRFVVVLTLAVTPALVIDSSAPSASAATSCHAWPSTYLKKENARRGSSGWRDVKAVTRSTAQFWLDTASAACGQQVGIHLAASGITHFQLWRLGWYRGELGRLLRSWNAAPGTSLAPAPASGSTALTANDLPAG